MAAVIEEQLGRAELILCLTDPSRLLRSYNEAARRHNRSASETLVGWSKKLVAALEPRPAPAGPG
jgi:hypothetical protein